MNLSLKIALLAKFGSQCNAAFAIGIHESHLSRLVRGRQTASHRDIKAFASVFGEEEARRLLIRKPESPRAD